MNRVLRVVDFVRDAHLAPIALSVVLCNQAESSSSPDICVASKHLKNHHIQYTRYWADHPASHIASLMEECLQKNRSETDLLHKLRVGEVQKYFIIVYKMKTSYAKSL